MENKDNETLEKIARVLIKVDNYDISDKEDIDKIMKITLENSTKKLKAFLDSKLKKKEG